jgi:uncharacterized protein
MDATDAVFEVRVTPRAVADEIGGSQAESLRVRLRAAPVEGRANEALLRLLGQALDLPVSRLEIVSGASGRRKRVRVLGLGLEEVTRRLGVSLRPPPRRGSG